MFSLGCSQGLSSILLQHKRALESLMLLSSSFINFVLSVNSDSAIYQQTIVEFDKCFIKNKSHSCPIVTIILNFINFIKKFMKIT